MNEKLKSELIDWLFEHIKEFTESDLQFIKSGINSELKERGC